MSVRKSVRVFSSNAVSPESLQTVLWETLQKTRKRKIKPQEANTIINAAKGICDVARLELQYKVLNGGQAPALPGEV